MEALAQRNNKRGEREREREIGTERKTEGGTR